MSSSLATSLNCTQCGGELHPDEGQAFITCPFCAATVYIDKAQVVFHWSLAPTLDPAQAAAGLRRWMSGAQTVKDLDQKAQITAQTFQYFPLWYFKFLKNNREEQALEPAAATSLTELRHLKLPAGDLQRYDPALDAQAEPPNVPLEAALGWLQQTGAPGVGAGAQSTGAGAPGVGAGAQSTGAGAPGVGAGALRETALVHVPIYQFKYTYQGRVYTAVVEAATGSVIANIYPAKAEAPYLLAGGISAAVYLCLALVLLAGILSEGVSGPVIAAVALGLAALATPILFAFAAWVASKI